MVKCPGRHPAAGIRVTRIVCLLVAAFLFSQCTREPRLAIVGPDGRQRAQIRLEIASTEPQREVGLMYRTSLPANAGMLFVFAKPGHQVFWMHNTEISLDMIFAGPNGRVIGVIADAKPYSDRQLSVDGLSQYVVEVNAGFCSRHGIKAGDRLDFINFVPHAQD